MHVFITDSVVDFESVIHSALFDTTEETLVMFVNDDIVRVPIITLVTQRVKGCMMDVQNRLKSLGLTDEEICLLLLVNTFSPGNNKDFTFR